jgi:hypothetical protein
MSIRAEEDPMTRRWLAIGIGCLLSGCGASGKAGDSGVGQDLSAAIVNLTGVVATELTLNLSIGGADGGSGQASTMTILGAWQADEPLTPNPDGTLSVIEQWQLCQLDIPGGINVPYNDSGLAHVFAVPPNGTMTGTGDDAKYTQPPFAFVAGALLANPLTDPLPDATAPLCSPSAKTGCLIANYATMQPGVLVNATGLVPDADTLYIAFRLALSFDAVGHVDGTLDGTVASAGLDVRVLSCHLRSGAMCSPSDVAAIQASRPALTISGGGVRSHVQGYYFTCPQMLGDPNGSVTGVELMDAGVFDGKASSMSYGLIQSDLDERGCATCHETRTGAGQLQLVFQPATAALVRQNYEAILPFTLPSSMQGLPGGRFVNQTPLPGPMRDRWLQWISQGVPY